MKKHWHCFINYSQHYLGFATVTKQGLKAGSLATGERLAHLVELKWMDHFQHALRCNFRGSLYVDCGPIHKSVPFICSCFLHFLLPGTDLNKINGVTIPYLTMHIVCVNLYSICSFAGYIYGISLNTPHLIYYYLCLFPCRSNNPVPPQG